MGKHTCNYNPLKMQAKVYKPVKLLSSHSMEAAKSKILEKKQAGRRAPKGNSSSNPSVSGVMLVSGSVTPLLHSLDLLFWWLEKIRNIPPNGGLLVICHGRNGKESPSKITPTPYHPCMVYLPTFDGFEW